MSEERLDALLPAPLVGDITPDIPKYPFTIANIFIIYRVVYAGMLKTLNQQGWAGLTLSGPELSSSSRLIRCWAGT
jgi:hypothetical protein